MQKLLDLIDEIGIEIAFLIALIATASSLFTSQILGWSPCVICTYQRVFMYPLTLTLGIAVFYSRKIWRYVSIGLAAVGAPISLYHHLFVRFDPTQGCGFALPCSMDFQFNFGFLYLRPMYIPLLSFIAFLIILLILVIETYEGENQRSVE